MKYVNFWPSNNDCRRIDSLIFPPVRYTSLHSSLIYDVPRVFLLGETLKDHFSNLSCYGDFRPSDYRSISINKLD